MANITDEITHKRTVNVRLEPQDVRRLLVAYAVDEAGIDPGKGVVTRFLIEQCEEGSPSYRVNKWKASLTIEIDMKDQPHDR